MDGLKNKNLPRLNPFLDDEGLLRMPYSHHITKLIIKKEHDSLLHRGIHSTLANLRLKY